MLKTSPLARAYVGDSVGSASRSWKNFESNQQVAPDIHFQVQNIE